MPAVACADTAATLKQSRDCVCVYMCRHTMMMLCRKPAKMSNERYRYTPILDSPREWTKTFNCHKYARIHTRYALARAINRNENLRIWRRRKKKNAQKFCFRAHSAQLCIFVPFVHSFLRAVLTLTLCNEIWRSLRCLMWISFPGTRTHTHTHTMACSKS